MAAGPAIRGAEPQIRSDSIGIVSSAVEFLEPKSPLRTTRRYAKAERAGIAKRKEAGVVQFTDESRDDDSAEAVTVEPEEPDGLGGVMSHLIGLAGFFTNPEQKIESDAAMGLEETSAPSFVDTDRKL